MSLTLYKCSDDRRTLSKHLTSQTNIGSIVIKKPTTILNPEILINYFSGVLDYNYCYISEFDRFYFIDNIEVMTGNMVAIRCSVDVLYTYNSSIRTLNAILLRNENVGYTEITDNKLPISKNKLIKVYEFEGGDFNINSATNSSYNFVINVMGGAPSQ